MNVFGLAIFESGAKGTIILSTFESSYYTIFILAVMGLNHMTNI